LSQAAPPTFLEATGLSKSFGTLRAVQDVSLRIARGEVIGLIGANGAGKSSLIKLLTGVVPADSGVILIDGARAHISHPNDALRHGIAAVQQELTLAPDHSVMENIFLGRLPTVFGIVSRPLMRKKSRELQARVGLDVDPDRSAGSLTPVQQRLVMVAASLAREAQLLILDEPTAALPHEESGVVHQLVRQLAEHGTAVIYISHRLHEVEELTSRVIVMRDGAVVAHLQGDEAHVDRMMDELAGTAAREEPEPFSDADRTHGLVLRVRGVSGSRTHNINFDVYEGEILGIAGLAGSGRSELLRLLYGSQTPRAGTVELRGRKLVGTPRTRAKRRVGYIAESRRTNLLRGMNVRSNVSVASLMRHSLGRVLINFGWERKAINDLIQRVALKGAPTVPIETLSGGNAQKALVARWLLREVDLMLLDEPTAGIDVHARAEIHNLLRRVAEQGMTIVLTSVEPEELVFICDRVLVLVEGEIVQEMTAPFDVERLIAASYSHRRPVAA
jgi:ribose transport system ATP-binding protein